MAAAIAELQPRRGLLGDALVDAALAPLLVRLATFAVHCGLALLTEAARRGDEVKRLHGFAGFNARVGIHTGGVVRRTKEQHALTLLRDAGLGKSRLLRELKAALSSESSSDPSSS